ncbi:immunity protein Imm33 domain-containing protein [Sphingomonas sp. RS6]
MSRLGAILSRWRRRWLGRYAIEDPRPIADSAPYTFFLPSENEVLALAPGDLAKLIVRSVPPSSEYAAERMWVTIERAQGDRLWGLLDSTPYDIPQLRRGARIAFRRDDVIDLRWGEDRGVRPPSSPRRREFWSRCLVDACVLEDRVPVHYVYREPPTLSEEGGESDSGWRIRGDYRGVDDQAVDAREIDYVALGKVLNVDDSWIHLIDEPVGSAFVRNWESGRFEPESAAAK